MFSDDLMKKRVKDLEAQRKLLDYLVGEMTDGIEDQTIIANMQVFYFILGLSCLLPGV